MIPRTILCLKIPHHTCGLCRFHAHYVSTTNIGVDPTPIECNPIALVPPPPHFGLEVGRAHPLLEEPTSHVSLIYENNFVSTPIKSDNITYLHGPEHSPHPSSSTDGLNGSTIKPSNCIYLPT